MAHTETIGTGETYTTIQTWEDGRDGVLDGIETGECKGEAFANIIFNGNSADSTNYMHLTAQSDAEHDGRAHEVSSAGNARIEHNAESECVQIQDNYTRVAWMEVKGPGNYGVKPLKVGGLGSCTTHVHHCIFHNNNAGGGSLQLVEIDDSDCEFRLYRNIFYGLDSRIYLSNGAANSCFYNNTIYKCDLDENYKGVYEREDNFTLKNNASFANPNGDLDISGATVDDNATSDATGDDAMDNLTTADQFVDVSNDYADTDLLCKVGADLIGVGTDLSGLTSTFPEIDISIDDRGGSSVSNWDVGASEYVAAGGTTLVVAALISAGSLDNVVLTQANVLAIQALSSSGALDNVTLTQAHVLAVQALTGVGALDNVSLSIILTVAEMFSNGTIDNITLTQKHTLAIQELLSSGILDNVTLSLSILLVLADLASVGALDNITLTQKHTLALQELISTGVLDNIALVQKHTLAVGALLSSGVLDNVTLTLGTLLTIQELLSAGSLDNVTVVQKHTLALQELLSTGSLDNIALSGLDVSNADLKDILDWLKHRA